MPRPCGGVRAKTTPQRLPEAVTLAGQARDLLQRVAALPGVGTETAAVK